MKTKNSKRFGLFCLLMLLVVGVQAQPTTWNYPKVENGNTIVSRDAAGGIKQDALLTTAQKAFLMNQYGQPIYNDNSQYNKVSAKFEVASADASESSTWTDAYPDCRSYSQTGAQAGSWRVPTQRELMLIWMFKSKLTGCGAIASATDSFWSSTQSGSNTYYTAELVTFYDGDTGAVDKIYGFSVRCVRDL